MPLVKYDAMCRAISDAHKVDEVKDIANRAAALTHYARMSNNRDAEAQAIEIRLRAIRRLGQLTMVMEKMKPKDSGALKGMAGFAIPSKKARLSEAGVSEREASRAEKLAKLSEDQFEATVSSTVKRIENPSIVAHVSQNTGDEEWYTPAYIVEAARKVMGGIDLDPASTAQANETVKAARYFTKEDDGLAKEWEGRVWLNPPYTKGVIVRFMTKFYASKIKAGVAITNNSTETNYGNIALMHSDAVCFLLGRVAFLHGSGEAKGNSPLQGQMILYRGEDTDTFRDVFCEIGAVLIPSF